MTQFNGGGLIARAFLAGSHDPSKYYKKYPKAQWIPKGKYELQTTPGEIAAVITHTKPYLRGKRMLCVGTETLGSERFIAESLGILEMDVIGESLPDNVAALKETKTVNLGKAPSGTYDIITAFGKADISKVIQHCKVGTFVVCLDVGPKTDNQELRKSWLGLRKTHAAYMTVFQSGGMPYETGIGVVKVLSAISAQSPTILKVIEPEVEDDDNDQHGNSGTEADESPETGVTGNVEEVKEEVRSENGERDGGNSEGTVSEVVPVVKRRGRQPGSKNKVKV